jgi:hypothetical protein
VSGVDAQIIAIELGIRVGNIAAGGGEAAFLSATAFGWRQTLIETADSCDPITELAVCPLAAATLAVHAGEAGGAAFAAATAGEDVVREVHTDCSVDVIVLGGAAALLL